MGNDDMHYVQVGYQQFFIDKRYVNLKACGDGSYGFVCSADDVVGSAYLLYKAWSWMGVLVIIHNCHIVCLCHMLHINMYIAVLHNVQRTGEKVAIKKITDVFIDLIDAKRILREIKLLRHFNAHENIVTILDIMSSPPGSVDIQDIYIVTNLMESDLERYFCVLSWYCAKEKESQWHTLCVCC